MLSPLNGVNSTGRLGYCWELRLPEETVIQTALTSAPTSEPPIRWAERRVKQAISD